VTLLIGTILNTNIIITADGLSLTHPADGGRIKSNTIQKIFPLTSMSVAIAHHGFNILDGSPVDEFLGKFMTTAGRDFTTLSVYQITVKLQEFTDPAAREILAVPKNKNVSGIGFWVAGFLTEKSEPVLYEIFWPNEPNPKKCGILTFGGNGRKFIEHHIDEFKKDASKREQLRLYSVADALKFHNDLYQEAEEKQEAEKKQQAGGNIFCGDKHQLLIKKDGCCWINKPDALK
jgi:hypothetical protein